MLAAVLAAAALTACGQKDHTGEPVVKAKNEGHYLELGELKYQVQVSRQLNADDPLDRAFLLGIPRAEQGLKTGETWFGVFLRVQNETSHPLRTSDKIEIVDTQENVYHPIELGRENVFAYRAHTPIGPRDLLPPPDTPAYETPIQGSLLLFKLSNASLDNRPLELKLESPEPPPQTGIIELDV